MNYVSNILHILLRSKHMLHKLYFVRPVKVDLHAGSSDRFHRFQNVIRMSTYENGRPPYKALSVKKLSMKCHMAIGTLYS